jgi:molybdopterin synthase catalytic subunit
MTRMIVRVETGPLSLDVLIRDLGGVVSGDEGSGRDAEVGAMVVFSGIVRAREGDRLIGHLDYDHYTGMAEREMVALAGRASERWPLTAVGLVHRVGEVPVGESSVLVVVLAGHRAEAFEAARFLIDELKKSVPIWKSPPKGV